MNRRAAFTPLHRPRHERRPICPGTPECRTLKRHKCRAPNPNGIPSQSPGLRGTSYPGSTVKQISNPNGVASFVARQSATTLLGLRGMLHRIPRVARSSQPWAGGHCPVGANPIHGPGYRRRYAEFLKRDFPRLPLTGNLDGKGVALGLRHPDPPPCIARDRGIA